MSNALTFDLGLENAGFESSGKQSLATIEAINAAAVRASANISKLQTSMAAKPSAQNLAAAAAQQLGAGTYTTMQPTAAGLKAVEVQANKTGDSLKGLKSIGKVGQVFGKNFGLLFAPEAAMQVMTLTSLVGNLKTGLAEAGTVGAKIQPFLGAIGVGVAAGMTVKYIIDKGTQAQTAKSQEALSKGAVLDQQKRFRERLNAIIDELVSMGKVTKTKGDALKKDLFTAEGIKRVQKQISPIYSPDQRSASQRTVDDLTADAKAQAGTELQQKLRDIEKKYAEQIDKLYEARAGAKNADLPKFATAEKDIKKAQAKDVAKVYEEFSKGLSSLVNEAQAAGAGPLKQKLLDIDKKHAERLEQLEKLRGSATPQQMASAKKDIDAAQQREIAQAQREAQGTLPPLAVTNLERMGAVFNGGTGKGVDHQKQIAVNTAKTNELMEKFLKDRDARGIVDKPVKAR